MRYITLGLVVTLLSYVGSQAQSAPAGDPQSAERSFNITLHADADRCLRAFGPTEEKRWSPEWDPKFISSTGNPSDPDFAVFRITHGGSESIWTLSVHDRQRGILQYVVFNPGRIVTVIEIRCTSAGEHLARATVTYRKTALVPEASTQVSAFAQHFAEEREHWEETIDRYLQASEPLR